METFLIPLINHTFLKLNKTVALQSFLVKLQKLPWKIMKNKILKKYSEDFFLTVSLFVCCIAAEKNLALQETI